MRFKGVLRGLRVRRPLGRIRPSLPSILKGRPSSSANAGAMTGKRRRAVSSSTGGAPGSQEYTKHLQKLYELEYAAEKQEIQCRTQVQSRKQLERGGLGISGLAALAVPEKPSTFRFFLPGNASNGPWLSLPWLSEFAVGRCVLVSDTAVEEVLPDSTTTVCAELASISRKELRVKLIANATKLPASSSQRYRIDIGPNKVAADRIVEVLAAISNPQGGSVSLGLLQGNEVLAARLFEHVADTMLEAKALDYNSRTCPNEHLNAAVDAPANAKPTRSPVGSVSKIGWMLNSSQRLGLARVRDQCCKLTLLQGPPGTGKTALSVEMVRAWLDVGKGQVLATAFSNQGVDNLAQGLQERGIKAVRMGSCDRNMTCNFDTMFDKYMEQINAVYKSFDRQKQMRRGKGKDKGKGKGKGKQKGKGTGKQKVAFLRTCDAICSTCIGIGMSLLNPPDSLLDLPYVIIDEAAQIIEPAVLLPLAKGSVQVVMVGDQCQLPATVMSKAAEEGGLGVSMFARLVAAGCHVVLLDTQYRMHSAIASFSGTKFYGGRLLNGIPDDDRHYVPLHPLTLGPLVFIHCDGREFNQGTSKGNSGEASCIAYLVKQLLSQGTCAPDIGVITPYTAQVSAIRKELRSVPVHGWNIAKGVSSVDAYQGSERRVILISLVRANDAARVGFLRDWRRMNVSLTRAKQLCVIVGHLPTLLEADSSDLWRHWIKHNLEGGHCDFMQWTGTALSQLDEGSKPDLCLQHEVAESHELLHRRAQFVCDFNANLRVSNVGLDSGGDSYASRKQARARSEIDVNDRTNTTYDDRNAQGKKNDGYKHEKRPETRQRCEDTYDEPACKRQRRGIMLHIGNIGDNSSLCLSNMQLDATVRDLYRHLPSAKALAFNGKRLNPSARQTLEEVGLKDGSRLHFIDELAVHVGKRGEETIYLSPYDRTTRFSMRSSPTEKMIARQHEARAKKSGSHASSSRSSFEPRGPSKCPW